MTFEIASEQRQAFTCIAKYPNRTDYRIDPRALPNGDQKPEELCNELERMRDFREESARSNPVIHSGPYSSLKL